MEYNTTAKGRSVVYLGLRVYEKGREDGTKWHQVHHSARSGEVLPSPHRALPRPRHGRPSRTIWRSHHGECTARRPVATWRTSRNPWLRSSAMPSGGGYPKQMVEQVWRSFLFQRWHAVDVRIKELRIWFPKVWAFLLRTDSKPLPEPTKPFAGHRTQSLPPDLRGSPLSALPADGAQPGSSSSSSQPTAPSAQPQPLT